LGTSGVGGIVAGILADRMGKRDILAVTILTYSMGSLIAALAPNYGRSFRLPNTKATDHM
jgi:MFS family permease